MGFHTAQVAIIVLMVAFLVALGVGVVVFARGVRRGLREDDPR